MRAGRFAFSASLLALTLAASSRGEPARNPLDMGSVERRVEELRKREHSLERVLARDVSQLEQAQQRIVARGRAYYRMSRARPAGDLFEHAVKLERLRRGLLGDQKLVRELSREKRGADQRIALLREHRRPLEVEVEAAGRARQALLSQQERERAFAQAFMSSGASRNHTAVYAAGANLELADTFAALRGQLPFPLPGRAEIEEVTKPFAAGPGLVLRAPPGTLVRAVFSGRVAYASEFAEYGRTVIVDHGDGYFTVTAQLGSIDVRVGEDLPAGVRLGTVGGQAGLGELYFEIRRGEQTIAPREWFGI